LAKKIEAIDEIEPQNIEKRKPPVNTLLFA
jgi:hypothetical protein